MDRDSCDEEGEGSRLGRKEHWDEAYAMELGNLVEHGDEGEIWFGEDVMETMVSWTAELIKREFPSASSDVAILDVGTGNGVLPLQFASLGFTRLTGSDYSTAAIQLACAVAERRGVHSVRWLVDDLLHTSMSDRFEVITDKGTFDAVSLSEDAAANRERYITAVRSLVKPQGLLVITSCNTTREELIEEFCGASTDHSIGARNSATVPDDGKGYSPNAGNEGDCHMAAPKDGWRFEYVDHVRSYPVFRFGGIEGSRVCTVAFRCI